MLSSDHILEACGEELVRKGCHKVFVIGGKKALKATGQTLTYKEYGKGKDQIYSPSV